MAEWEVSLERLVKDRGTALIRYGYLLCGDRDEAEDLVQDALMRTFAAGRRRLEAGTAEGYVRRAMLNAYIDGFRRRRRWAAVRHLFTAAETTASTESLTTGRIDVEVALSTLSARQRACLVLRFYEDMTVPMIADHLSLSQGTVKRYLSDATKEISAALGLVEAGEPTGAPTRPSATASSASYDVVDVVRTDTKPGRS